MLQKTVLKLIPQLALEDPFPAKDKQKQTPSLLFFFLGGQLVSTGGPGLHLIGLPTSENPKETLNAPSWF